MKKLLLSIALLAGGTLAFVPKLYAEDPEICIPGKPCVYDGYAYKDHDGRHGLKIQVYPAGGEFIVRFRDSENKVHEAYAIKCGPCEYYINYNGKYYFEM